jgi:hypothetical protein
MLWDWGLVFHGGIFHFMNKFIHSWSGFFHFLSNLGCKNKINQILKHFFLQNNAQRKTTHHPCHPFPTFLDLHPLSTCVYGLANRPLPIVCNSYPLSMCVDVLWNA